MNKQKTALLIGNDINKINNRQSWEQLLKKVILHLEIGNEVDSEKLKSKPFPLLYEEIFLRALAKDKHSEIELKKLIVKLTIEIEHNIIHERIMNMGILDVMTTNYEYSLQRSTARSSEDLRNVGYIKERTYNIFRHNEVNKTKVWHIHGECNIPRSITLGYEQYCGLLQQMRNYIVSGTEYKNKEKNLVALIKRIDNNEIQEHSWLDLFFSKDIHIIGLSLDTAEIDLWWLLTYRARQMLQKDGLRVNNTIYYYHPARYKTDIYKSKLQLLEANQVKIISIDIDEKTKYYNKILDIIEK